MMTSTWSTSASLRTALTASPGVALLSANEASSLRPMMPPFALISSTASVAPARTPSPVIAAGPLIAEAKPMRMGGACAPTDNAPAESAASSRVKRVRATRMKGLLLSNHNGEVLAGAGELACAGRRHLDGVLDLHAAPAVLVVRRLDAEHHPGLQRGVRRRIHPRRVVGLHPPPSPAPAPHLLLVRPRGLALGDGRLQHGQPRGDPGLGDERRALEGRHLPRSLHHARLPEHLVGGDERRWGQALLDALPRGREQVALVEAHAPAEDAEVAEDAGQRLGGGPPRRPRPPPEPAGPLPRPRGLPR